MKNWIKANKLMCLLLLASACFIGLGTSHYSESLLTPSLKALKNLYVAGAFSRYKKEGGSLYTSYSFEQEPVLNPVHIAGQAFDQAELALISSKSTGYERLAYNQSATVDETAIVELAEYFLFHYKEEVINGLSVVRLPYNFDYPKYDLKAPWYSGMAQGLAIVVVLAAYDITGESRFLVFAEKLGNLLTVPVDQGGTLIEISPGIIWHEEYADEPPSIRPLVLNGNNFAIDGLFWLSRMSLDEKWHAFLYRSIKSLSIELKEYEGIYWSKYSQYGDYASWHYHDVHINQLKKIDQFYMPMSGMKQLSISEYWKKFEAWQSMPFGFTERLIRQTNNLVLAIYLLNVLFLCLVFFCVLLVVLKRRKHVDDASSI